MATRQNLTSKEMEMTSVVSHTTMPSKKLSAKNIFSNVQQTVIIDPIDPKRISKESTNSLTNVLSCTKI